MLFPIYVSELGFNDATDFWGVDHFDALGAQKTTDYLCKYIDSNYDIPDRRGDSGYAYWENDVPEWDEQLKSYIEQDMSTP